MEIPVYAPIQGFAFDGARLLQEIEEKCVEEVVERSVVFKNEKSIHDVAATLSIASDEALKNTTHYEEADGQMQTRQGKYSTYRVLNITRLPEDPVTTWHTYMERRGHKIAFWHYYRKPWTWMKELENSYLREVVEQFPFEYVQTVRLITMRPPAIGQVHVDTPTRANNRWLEEGFASITLNVSSGGSRMRYLVGTDSFDADPEIQISHFNDAYRHGVPELKSTRHQIRIFGKMDQQKYLAMMDLKNAVRDTQPDV